MVGLEKGFGNPMEMGFLWNEFRAKFEQFWKRKFLKFPTIFPELSRDCFEMFLSPLLEFKIYFIKIVVQ